MSQKRETGILESEQVFFCAIGIREVAMSILTTNGKFPTTDEIQA